ncbi:MAG: YggS family pyridoxal phosphate-dependent enzyme [Burkholderiales bacterium]
MQIIAASKTFPPEAIAGAISCGQTAFGENYVQEALEKMAALPDGVAWHATSTSAGGRDSETDVRHSAGVRPRNVDGASREAVERAQQSASAVARSTALRSGALSPQAGLLLRPLEWHMIGPIQSNKTREIAEHFDWVHSVDREKIARRLSEARPASLPALNVCIQVNVSGEASKSGVEPGETLALAQRVAQMPRLRLRGLMAIPEPSDDPAVQRARFRSLRELRDRIAGAGIAMDTLSMGMTDDLESAIAEGATMVRVGRAIFGDRARKRG